EAGIDILQKLRADLLEFRAKEKDLNANSALPDDPTIVAQKTGQSFKELEKIKQSIDKHLEEARNLNATFGEWTGIQQAYEILVKQSETNSKDAFDLVLGATDDFTRRPDAALTGAAYPLFSEVAGKLRGVQKDLKEKIETGFTKEQVAQLHELDELL